MILEYAQLLSTAHRIIDGTLVERLSEKGRKQKRYVLPDFRETELYAATHANHPSAIWVRQSDKNYMWLAELLEELCAEYTYRYGKVHKVQRDGLMQTLKNNFPSEFPNTVFTEPTPAMPDYCKVPNNSIASYRNYYIQEKGRMAVWKARPVPLWYVNKEITNASV